MMTVMKAAFVLLDPSNTYLEPSTCENVAVTIVGQVAKDSSFAEWPIYHFQAVKEVTAQDETEMLITIV